MEQLELENRLEVAETYRFTIWNSGIATAITGSTLRMDF